MSDLANLIERPKQPTIRDFRPIGAIEAFDEGVLIGLAGWMWRSSLPITAHQVVNRCAVSSGP